MINKRIIYFIFVTVVFTACETLYNPNLDDVDSIIVVDARLAIGGSENTINITKSVGFNDMSIFQTVDNAEVQITDDNNNVYECWASGNGNYRPGFHISKGRMYKLKVIYDGQTYESDFESVPEKPFIDSLYVENATRIIKAEDDALENLYRIPGKQTYVDISGITEPMYFRFSGKKILQYVYNTSVVVYGVPQIVTSYSWRTYRLSGSFNVAGPAEYSSSFDIKRHALEFFDDGTGFLIPPRQHSYGWIYIVDQYAISESSYKFYEDLNNQLGADGKFFDPMYVQARSNIKCTSDPDKIILGNFEIANHTEYRYFLRFDNRYIDIFKKIDEFLDIPFEGESDKGPPEFWVFGT